MPIIVFNPFLVLFWIFIISFIPGALLALALLKKYDLRIFEKIFIGFAIGLIIPSLIAFVINLTGIHYSFGIAILSVIIFYAISVYLFWREKAYQISLDFKISMNLLIPIALFAIMFLSFWIRLQAYSPVYYELDPYFYAYPAQQLLTIGLNPFEDHTAWYPEVLNDHRTAEAISFMEANWYSFYTLGGPYNNYLLALVSNLYPPLVSSFFAFFAYLLVSIHTRRSYGLISAALLSFMPIFLLKMAAGQFQALPLAFFTIAMFLACYALSIKLKSKSFAIIALIAYFGLSLGTSSEVVVITALLFFIPLQAIALFLKEKDKKEIYDFLNINLIIFTGIICDLIIKRFYTSGSLSLPFTQLMIAFLTLGLTAILYLIKDKIKDFEISIFAFLFLILVGFLAVAFTPIGKPIKEMALSSIGLAQYNYALQKTIAEQPPAHSDDYVGDFGTIGDRIPIDAASFLNFLPDLANKSLSGFINLINSALGSHVDYQNTLYYQNQITENNQAKLVYIFHPYILGFFTIFPLLCLLALYRYFKGENNIALLLIAAAIPPSIVGLLKVKYITYFGFFLSVGFAFSLGELELLIDKLLRKIDFGTIKFDKSVFPTAFLFLIILGGAITYKEFSDVRYPPPKAILESSFQTRFQDNPLAAQEKLMGLCNSIKAAGGGIIQNICDPAKDPIGYASKGTIYQYNDDLCFYSSMADPWQFLLKKQEFDQKSAAISGRQNAGQLVSETEKSDLQRLGDEINSQRLAATYRCTKLNDYWVETMEWLKNKSEPDAVITSWWDYGHWTNFLGQRNTVLRNEHSSTNMIGRVAYSYLHGSLDDLKKTMKDYNSKYALFDIEIAGLNVGGKYGALNYLGCDWSNQTNVSYNPGTSPCEIQHTWETIFVPVQNNPSAACTISNVSNKTGVIAFYGLQQNSNGQTTGLNGPAYCMGNAMLATAKEVTSTYYLNNKYANGDLKLNKATLIQNGAISDSAGNPIILSFILMYTKDPIWLENGTVTDGYADRKGKYYDSNLYRAFFLKDLPGYQLVYESSQATQYGGDVKIYKLTE